MVEQRYRYQARNGVERFLIFDDERPDRFVVQTSQDVEPILESVARDRELMRNDGANKVLGRVPIAVYERAVHEDWGEDDWRKWWNGEGRAFRIWNPGGEL
jgi:hypothetical protein